LGVLVVDVAVDVGVDADGDNELFNIIDCLRTLRFVTLLLLFKSFILFIDVDDDDEGDDEQDENRVPLLLLPFNEVGDFNVKIGFSFRIVVA
jgi:hypothetical protein